MIEEKSKKQFIIVKSIVVNDKGEILFIRRKLEENREAHNKWEFPGGKIEFGETPENAIIRETKEETGYNIELKHLLPKLISSGWISPQKESHQILICYICKLKNGEMLLQDHGVSEIKWFNKDEVPSESECLPGTIDFLKIYLKRDKCY